MIVYPNNTHFKIKNIPARSEPTSWWQTFGLKKEVAGTAQYYDSL